MFQKLITTIIFALALHTTSGAQIVFSSVEDAWKYADEHNISIKNANYELQKTQYARKQSYLAFLPTVNASGSFTDNTNIPYTIIPSILLDKNAKPGEVKQVQFGQTYVYNAGLNAQIDLVNPQTWYNLNIAKETEELNKAGLANAKKQTYQQIAGQYYLYMLNKEAERLAGKSVAISDSVLRSVTNKYNEGVVSLANLDIAKLNNERAQQTYITAQYQSKTSINNLKGILSLSVKDSLAITGTLQTINIPLTPGNYKEDPSVLMANYQAKVNRDLYRASNAAVLPSITLGYNATVQNNNNNFTPIYGGTTFPASFWTIKASWNIFTAGSRWLQVQKNKMNYLESTAQYENNKNQSEINDANLTLSYEKATALLKKSENVMNLSYDNYRHVTGRYEEGLVSIDERLNAFGDYINYQNQYLNSLSDMLVQMYNVKIRQQSFK